MDRKVKRNFNLPLRQKKKKYMSHKYQLAP